MNDDRIVLRPQHDGHVSMRDQQQDFETGQASAPQNLGSAAWQDPALVELEYAYEPGSIWLGRTPRRFDSKACTGESLGLDEDDDRHIMLIGGTRAGKGTTSIIPNLCLWPGSLMVIDPKGENATITAARRGSGSETVQGIGQRTYVLDPFGVARNAQQYRARFNPIAQLIDPKTGRPGTFAVEEAAQLAAAIVVDKDTSSADPFWNDAARAMIETLILHVISSDSYIGRRNLATIRELIVAGDTLMVASLRAAGKEEAVSPYELLWDSITDNPAFNGVVARSGEDFLNRLLGSEKQFIDVRTNASVHTKFLDSEKLADCLSDSDFRLEDLKTDPKGISVFICLPQWLMGTHYRWMRLITSLATTQMEKTPGPPLSGHRVLMVLDEFAGLKRMESIENSAAQYAGAYLKMFFGLQNLDQLKREYPNGWQSLMGLCGIKIFFGIDCDFTAQHLSKSIGNTEIVLENNSGGTNTSDTTGWTKGGSSTETNSVARGRSTGTTHQTTNGSSQTATDGTTRGTASGTSQQNTQGRSQTDTESQGRSNSQTTGSSSGQSRRWHKGFISAQVFDPWVTDNYGRSNSSTTGTNEGHSRAQGSSSGQSDGRSFTENEGTSQSQARGMSSGKSDGTSITYSETATHSEAQGKSWGESGGRSDGRSFGWNQTRQKRPLIEPDEIMRYFARVKTKDKDRKPAYPGLAAVMIGGENPIFMRRTIYYEDVRFKGLYGPHPDHQEKPEPVPEPTPEAIADVAPVSPVAAPYTPPIKISWLFVYFAFVGLVLIGFGIVAMIPWVVHLWQVFSAWALHAWEVFVYGVKELVQIVLGVCGVISVFFLIWVFSSGKKKD